MNGPAPGRQGATAARAAADSDPLVTGHAEAPDGAALPGPRPLGAGTFWEGRAGVVVPTIVVAWSLFLIVGSVRMDDRDADFPGPQFFPVIIGVVGLVLAGLQVLALLRSPEPPENHSGRSWRTHTDWVAIAWTVGGFLAFAVLLPWLGWILAGALLFWCVARGFGSRRALFDLVLALFMSSVAYLGFDVGLGLNLPSGILGGGF